MEYINAGYSYVVNLDLEQFLDTVNYDCLMNELGKKLHGKRLLKLVHSILQATIQVQGNQIPCKKVFLKAAHSARCSPTLFWINWIENWKDVAIVLC